VLIGECGTGKSHLATGLCVEACRQKRRVRFTTAAALVAHIIETGTESFRFRRTMERRKKKPEAPLTPRGVVESGR
jgi:DNA replication protein DnaC